MTVVATIDGTPILRTDDGRFENLEGYPFAPHYTDIEGMRMHHVDEGTGDPILMLHGEPSWSYLYRRMIPMFADAGYRAIAPDIIGFGKSDKPADTAFYTYERHVSWMSQWLETIGLSNITLICQDWGSLIGLRLVAAMPEKFARVVVSNGALPTGEHKVNPAFQSWIEYSQSVPELRVGRIIQGGTVTELSDAVVSAYDAPYPTEEYKAGARIFPALVPITPDAPSASENRTAWKSLMRFEKPFLTAFSDQDKILAGADRPMQRLILGAKGQPHTIIENASHFVQEDNGEALAQVTINWMVG